MKKYIKNQERAQKGLKKLNKTTNQLLSLKDYETAVNNNGYALNWINDLEEDY